MGPTRFERHRLGRLALYRPGPMGATRTPTTRSARPGSSSRADPPRPEDALEPILGDTYHLVVYQEQVMAIAQQLAGYSLGGADILRRAMGKKKKEDMDKPVGDFLRRHG